MKNLNRWFRKNQKKLLACLVVFLMVAWGIGGAAEYLIPKPPYGTIAGEKISRETIGEMARRWQAVLYSRSQLTAGLVENVWHQLTLVKAAERAGLTVTETELDDALDKPGGQFTWIRYQVPRGTAEKTLRKTVAEMILGMKAREYLRGSLHATTAEAWYAYALQNEQVKVRFAEISAEAFEPLVKPKDEELRAFYEQHKDKPVSASGDTIGYRQPEKVKIEYLLARTDDFKKDVKITDEQIETYYNDNKDMKFRLPDPEPEKKEEEQEGEKADAKPAAEAKATAEAAQAGEAKKPEVGTAEEKGDKEDAKTAEGAAEKEEAKPAAEAKATVETAQADGAAEPGAKPAEEDGGKQDGKAADTAAEKGATSADEEEEKEDPPKPKYKPLSEVKEEIVKELTNSAAEEKAIAAINAADVEIGEAIVDEPISFPELAKEMGLVHKVTEFFAKDGAGDILLGAYKLAEGAFDRQRFVNDPAMPLDCTDGKFIFQVLAKRDPMPDPFEEIRDKVRADFVNVKALEKAKAFVLDGADVAEAKGFEEGVAELTKKLEAMLPPKPAKVTKAEAPDPKKEGEKEEDAEEAEKPLIRVGETEFFSRPETYGEETYCYIPELEGDRPKVGGKAFKLKPDEYGVAVEETGQRAAYIIQVTGRKEADPTEFGRERTRQITTLRGRKQDRIMKQWDEGVKKTAIVVGRR